MSDINKRGVENWLIEALKSYDGLMSTNPDKEHKWQAKLKLQALIQEQVKEAYDRGYADKAIKADKDLVERVMRARNEEWAKIHTQYQSGDIRGQYKILEAVERVNKNTRFRVECQKCNGVMFRYSNKFRVPHKNCVEPDLIKALKGEK